MSYVDDDLFEDENRSPSSSKSPTQTSEKRLPTLSSSRSLLTEDGDEEFYEKLGGSLYGDSNASTVKQQNNVRFRDSIQGRDSFVGSLSGKSPLLPPPMTGQIPTRDSYNMMSHYPSFEYVGPEYPQSAYNRYSLLNLDDMASMPRRVSHNGYSQMAIPMSPDNYNVNLLEDAGDDMDPFGDDDSLFSEADEDEMRRGVTLRRTPTQARQLRASVEDDEDDDFTPRLNYTKTVKRARLVDGNFIIDAPVPKSLLNNYARPSFGDSNETSFVRYSGVTCGPSNFTNFRYNLRQILYNPPRETEILVCVTMYNEDEVLLGRTLKGVFENIKNLTNRKDPTWGDGSWKKVTVLIINDGRLQLNDRTKKLLTALGVYQEGYAKSKINESPVKAHLYEYTTTVGIERVSDDRVYLNVNLTPVQLVFCLKETNSKKINSHRWCFQAFAPTLNPKVVMLLDCGTKPSKDAFYHLWAAFKDPNVAGACGEMRVALGPNKKLLGNPLIAAQNFEYKVSNVLDKPMEAVFGFISVLPGAFSAYRWDALLNVDGQGPLEKYFKGEFLHQNKQLDQDDDEFELMEKNFQESGIFTSNMYLAEDRILCFELVAKRNHNYVLRYVSGAKAETDAPEKIDDFVLQRRRWLNGSLFAAIYSIFHWTEIWRSNHSLLRKLWLQLEFYYHLCTVLVSWFSLACFFLVFHILTRNLGSPEVGFRFGKYLSEVFLWVYIACLVCTFVLAFGNTPRGTKKFYTVIAGVFAVLMAYLLFAAVFLAINTVKLVIKNADGNFTPSMLFGNEKFRDLVVSVLSTYILYALGAVLHGQPSIMVTSFLQYLLLSPTYINVLNTYSFCNIHDVSWGNRDAPAAKDLGTAKITEGKNGDLVMTVVPASEQGLEDIYLQTLDDLKVPAEPETKTMSKKQKDDAYYALLRTITVLVWMLTNGILVAIVMAVGGKRDTTWNDYRNATIFLTIILWVVCALAGFRLIGSVLYMLQKIFRPMKWWAQKKNTV